VGCERHPSPPIIEARAHCVGELRRSEILQNVSDDLARPDAILPYRAPPQHLTDDVLAYGLNKVSHEKKVSVRTESDPFGEVTHGKLSTLRTVFPSILSCLTRRGAGSDVVRVHRMLPDRRDFEPCCRVLRRYFGEARPVATTIEAGLADGRAKIKIEVSA